MHHKCDITGCKVTTTARVLFCPEHWQMVPDYMKSEILEHYKAGQAERGRYSEEWFYAVQNAVRFVEFRLKIRGGNEKGDLS